MSPSRPSQRARPHSASRDNHNQAVADPVAHFEAIPWCAALLADPAVLDVVVPDRRPLASGESSFVRKVVNTPETVRACVTFFRLLRPQGKEKKKETKEMKKETGEEREVRGSSVGQSQALLEGGGKADGEDPRNPFLLFTALLDIGGDCNSFKDSMHGGLITTVMDEVMGTAANFQAKHGAYTVKLTTRFRKAVKTPQVLVVRARVVRVEGRKIHCRGTMEDKDGNVLAEAESLWLSMGRDIGRSQL